MLGSRSAGHEHLHLQQFIYSWHCSVFSSVKCNTSPLKELSLQSNKKAQKGFGAVSDAQPRCKTRYIAMTNEGEVEKGFRERFPLGKAAEGGSGCQAGVLYGAPSIHYLRPPFHLSLLSCRLSHLVPEGRSDRGAQGSRLLQGGLEVPVSQECYRYISGRSSLL